MSQSLSIASYLAFTLNNNPMCLSIEQIVVGILVVGFLTTALMTGALIGLFAAVYMPKDDDGR